MLEPLETRVLFAASTPGSVLLDGRTLRIIGLADKENVVSVRLSGDGRNVVVASTFGVQEPSAVPFAIGLVRRIVYTGGSGADLVTLGSAPPDDPATTVDESEPDRALTRADFFNADGVADPNRFADDERFTFRTRADGKAGDDVLVGGHGRDDLRGGNGNDVLFGQGGVDRLGGGDGNDVLEGGTRRDRLAGGTGADRFNLVQGSQAADLVSCGSDKDDDRIEFINGLGIRQRRPNDVVSDLVP